MTAVDVFVGNYTLIDFELYDLWLNGYSVHDAALFLQKSGVLQKADVSMEIVFSDIQDQYRLFTSFEKLLKSPPKLMDQQIYQMGTDLQKRVIERYYRFDSVVVREILGKKLSSRNRKDMDDVSEKTRIPLRSCRRQFDNLKRVFKTVEDMMGSLVENIKTHYLLSEDLARQYAAIVFIANNRFETGKKRLSHLTFEDFVFCANQMITNWSYSSADCKVHEDMDVDLDRRFLQDLRELKMISEKEVLDEHKGQVISHLKQALSKKSRHMVEESFKNCSKAIISIACGLNHSKDARDIFLDLVEKVTEPCLSLGMTAPDMETFLGAYKDAIIKMDVFRHQPHMLAVWDRYMRTLILCVLQIFHT
ncbi:acidic fibroblast growth factor intracellular-binding protein-like [Ostrea edulis]|uniref:acidic fibroblast growth factor intracellular-binding protein-like n=1 Tax=Ostrea edulis TaxID=37623 RepID=UPI0024AF7038|nr:acidic fibroblast growth factor intracellular-binding protein-like [Ostrea edulis]